MIKTVKTIESGAVHTAEVNYGAMDWYLVDGRRCCTRDMSVVRKATAADIGDIGSMMIGDTFYGASIECKDYWSHPSFFAQKKSEVLDIARSLSKGGLSTSVIIHARVVAWFKDGELIGEVKTLDEFYNNLSEDEINVTDLTGTLNQ